MVSFYDIYLKTNSNPSDTKQATVEEILNGFNIESSDIQIVTTDKDQNIQLDGYSSDNERQVLETLLVEIKTDINKKVSELCSRIKKDILQKKEYIEKNKKVDDSSYNIYYNGVMVDYRKLCSGYKYLQTVLPEFTQAYKRILENRFISRSDIDNATDIDKIIVSISPYLKQISALYPNVAVDGVLTSGDLSHVVINTVEDIPLTKDTIFSILDEYIKTLDQLCLCIQSILNVNNKFTPVFNNDGEYLKLIFSQTICVLNSLSKCYDLIMTKVP